MIHVHRPDMVLVTAQGQHQLQAVPVQYTHQMSGLGSGKQKFRLNSPNIVVQGQVFPTDR